MHIRIHFIIGKGNLISEGILTLVSLPTKGVKSLPWADNSNFLPFAINNVFKFSAQGIDLAPFVGNGTIFKISFDIKLPLNISFVRITYNPVAVFGCCFNSLKATTKQRILKVWNRAVALLLYLPVPAVFLLWIYANCKIASAFPVRLNFTWWIGWSQFWRHIIISMHWRFHEMFVELSL